MPLKRGKISSGTLWAWVTAALIAPFSESMGSAPWPWALGLTLGAGVLFLCAESATGRQWHCGKVLAWVELLFLILAAAFAADQIGWLRGEADSGWCFSAVLLVLAAWSAEKGGNAAGRCGAALLWLAGIGFILLTICALPDAAMENLYPASRYREGGATLLAALLPGAALLLPREKGKNPWAWVMAWAGAAGVIAILTSGVLSPEIAGQTQWAFLKMLDGAELLGIPQRLDGLAACVVTISWFCLLSLLLSCAGRMGGILREGKESWAIWAAAGIAFAARKPAGKLPAVLLGAGAVLMWFAAPAAKAHIKAGTLRLWRGKREK